MPALRDDIKNACRKHGRTLADLTRATKIPYPRLSGACNGYWDLSALDEQLIRQVFQRWGNEKLKQPRASAGMRRSEFNRLSDGQRAEYIAGGGHIVDGPEVEAKA